MIFKVYLVLSILLAVLGGVIQNELMIAVAIIVLVISDLADEIVKEIKNARN